MRNYHPRSNPAPITPFHTTSTTTLTLPSDLNLTDINSQLAQIDQNLLSTPPRISPNIPQESYDLDASSGLNVVSTINEASDTQPQEPVKMLVLPLTSPENKTWPIFAGLSLIGVGCWALTRLE